LAYFHCVNCFAGGRLVVLLQSIPCTPSSLKYLNVSRNVLNFDECQQLTKIISKHRSLEVVNLSGINLSSKYSTDLFVELSLLPCLDSVDLSNNPLGPLFFESLQQCTSQLTWKSLNLENIG